MCRDLKITNNIVAGARWLGISAFGHECGKADTQVSFRNNVVHSVIR